MSPEAQRIAIATAVGYTNIRPCTCGKGWLSGTSPDGKEVTHIFDWLNDLNAIHEAEKVLTDEQHAHFRNALAAVVTRRKDTGTRLMSHDEYRRWFSATAAQRAEAFLRTFNLWDDSK